MTDKTAIEALAACAEIEQFVIAIERYEEYTDGQPNLGTCKNLGAIKIASKKAREALAAIETKKTAEGVAEIVRMIRTTDMFNPDVFDSPETWCINRIQQYAESYHAEQCTACRKDRQPLPEAPRV